MIERTPDGEIDWKKEWAPTFASLIVFIIIGCLLYRLYFFLRYGYNPTIEIDTFFPQSGSEFGWKGIESIYDFIASSPLEVVLSVFIVVGFILFIFIEALWDQRKNIWGNSNDP